MQIASLTKLSSIPNAASIIGSQGSKHVIEAINANSGAVYFGSNLDPRAGNYMNFKNIYSSMDVQNELMKSQFYVMGMNDIIPITSEESLIGVPPIMQLPILTYEPIRHYYNNGMIEGWNMEVPEEVEDTMGRLINNGLIEPHFNEDGKWVMPEEIVWDYKYEDPEITDEELDMMDETRRFFASFIRNEILPGGERRDPTCSEGSFGTIGKLK